MKSIRRTIIVEGFQFQFVATLMVWLAFWLFVFGVLLEGPLVWQLLASTPTAEQKDLAAVFLTLHSRLWLPLAALFLGLAHMFFRVTHRVAGPLYRFRQIFRQLAEGDLTVPVRIRKGDYLVQECEALEQMVDAIRERVRHAQAAAALLRSHVDSMTGPTGERFAEQMAGLMACVENTEAALAELVTEPQPGDASPVPQAADALRPPRAATSDAGFSLIELLIVSSIVSSLIAMGVPGYQSALDRARVTRAMGDINAIGKEVTMFQISRACFPGSLQDIGRDVLMDPWHHPYAYAVPKSPGGGGKGGGSGGSCQACLSACVPPGAARKDHNLVPINSDFDLYSAGKDGKTAAPLTAATSQDDIIRARDGGFIGLASTY